MRKMKIVSEVKKTEITYGVQLPDGNDATFIMRVEDNKFVECDLKSDNMAKVTAINEEYYLDFHQFMRDEVEKQKKELNNE